MFQNKYLTLFKCQKYGPVFLLNRLQKYRFKYVIYKNQLLLQFKEQKASE